jgi:branched-chain amino acid transport system permease protein
MLGGYLLVFLFVDKEIPYLLSIVITLIVMLILGLLFERIVVHPTINKTWREQLVATLATSIILSNVAILFWGTTPRLAPTKLSLTILRLGPITISSHRFVVFFVAVISFIALSFFTKNTKIGKAMRAASQNRDACLIYGINVNFVSLVTVTISTMMSGLAGVIITPLYNVSPTVGSVMTLKALTSVVMGGLGNTTGAIISAFILGIVEALFSGYVSSQYQDVASFVIMILILVFRPHGMFGKKVGI